MPRGFPFAGIDAQKLRALLAFNGAVAAAVRSAMASTASENAVSPPADAAQAFLLVTIRSIDAHPQPTAAVVRALSVGRSMGNFLAYAHAQGPRVSSRWLSYFAATAWEAAKAEGFPCAPSRTGATFWLTPWSVSP